MLGNDLYTGWLVPDKLYSILILFFIQSLPNFKTRSSEQSQSVVGIMSFEFLYLKIVSRWHTLLKILELIIFSFFFKKKI